MNNLLNNEWIIGIFGGILSGLIVTFISKYLFSDNDKKEYVPKIETITPSVEIIEEHLNDYTGAKSHYETESIPLNKNKSFRTEFKSSYMDMSRWTITCYFIAIAVIILIMAGYAGFLNLSKEWYITGLILGIIGLIYLIAKVPKKGQTTFAGSLGSFGGSIIASVLGLVLMIYTFFFIGSGFALYCKHNAIAKERLKDYKSAIAYYNKAIKLSIDSDEYYEARGKDKYILKDYSGAIEDCTNVKSKTAYAISGKAKAAIGDIEGSISDFNNAK